ncbi:hypothetical protein SISSUDRAFT_1056359 [Sistotremastrum suecicum HHB10207 ss-3]|uniref:Uncharacterized protein n=1 Tax=Sistotremastrum suecicum HHB10207 ss-3 TaxID=1314776 RepID=A0A165WZI7_9AGAM|nr:hypothetical protein SISSUDRAFT_1056359 [Sistotremastrum suecicum HHB10207 ss-3]
MAPTEVKPRPVRRQDRQDRQKRPFMSKSSPPIQSMSCRPGPPDRSKAASSSVGDESSIAFQFSRSSDSTQATPLCKP